jgi:pseudouridine synthase
MATLLRALVEASGLSRRKAFAAIRDGRVAIDGRRSLDPSSAFEGGRLSLDGVTLRPAAAAKTYLLLHKPPGVLSTRSDERGRRTVLDLVPARLRAPGLHPVGRLDRETSGLLLLTDDGALTFQLTHPRHEVEKEYWLRTAPLLDDGQIQRLRAGIEIDGKLRRPVAVRRLPDDAAPFQASISLREGRKRQVRRMVEALGARVTRLHRAREGPLRLNGLPEGAVRPLKRVERRALGLDASRE